MRHAILVTLLTLTACTEAVEVPVYRSTDLEEASEGIPDPEMDQCYEEALEDLMVAFEEEGEVSETVLLDCPMTPRQLPSAKCGSTFSDFRRLLNELSGVGLGPDMFKCCITRPGKQLNVDCDSVPCGGWQEPACP